MQTSLRPNRILSCSAWIEVSNVYYEHKQSIKATRLPCPTTDVSPHSPNDQSSSNLTKIRMEERFNSSVDALEIQNQRWHGEYHHRILFKLNVSHACNRSGTMAMSCSSMDHDSIRWLKPISRSTTPPSWRFVEFKRQTRANIVRLQQINTVKA